MYDHSDPNPLESAIGSLVKQAIALEKNYKEMLFQGDEVDNRIQLWRDAIEICKMDSKGSHVESTMCQLCTILQIPDVFSSGSLAHLHSPAHVAILQHRLADALGHLYNHSYSFALIDEKIDLCHDALVFLNEYPDHMSPAPAMASLGAALCTRFTISAQQNDLQEGLKLLSSTVHICPSDPLYLVDLGTLLMYLYLVSGSLNYLDESLVFLRRAHDLRIGHPARGRICQSIAAATILKDQHFGLGIAFCWEALVEHYKELLLWQPSGHYSHYEGWDGLGMVFRMQFSRTNNIDDLNHAVQYGQTAYTMLNPRHPRAYRYSCNLCNAFHDRYEALGNPTDLELALFHAKRALELGPPERRLVLMRNLTKIMTSAAEYSGNMEMLSEGLHMAREALSYAHGESQKLTALETLGNILIVKASHFGDIEDLREGIHHIQQLLECVDEGTTFYFYGAVTTSAALLQYYEMDPSQQSHTLAVAIDLLKRVRGGTIPEQHRAEVLHWTAKAHRAQFHHRGLPGNLKSAFALDQQALELRPPGHPLRCMSLAAISDDLVGLFVIGESINLESVVNTLKEVLKGMVEGHPELHKVTISLAKLLLIPNTPYTNYEKAFTSLLHLLRDLRGSAYRCVVDMIPVLRFVETHLASKLMVDDYIRRQCLDIYQALINILPHLASLSMDWGYRIQVLSQARDIATKASLHAIILKQFDCAVELLESGRAVFWSQHLRRRMSFDSLDNDTAKELRDISRRLEIVASSTIPPDLDINLARARIERGAAEQRRLSNRFDELIAQVRLQPGMHHFMRNLNYMALKSAAIRGPVVILQLSLMCVITTTHADPRIIPLPDVTHEWLQGAVHTLRFSARAGCNRLGRRGAKKRQVDGAASRNLDEYDLLADIWRRIIQPLLGFLGWEKQEDRKRPRLFLCPTGIFSFLPIHAAGLYDTTGGLDSSCLSDYCVVSYTPTLGSLLTSRGNSNHLRREEVRFLLAAASDPFTLTALPEAQKEADVILQILPAHLLTSTIPGESPHTRPMWVSTAEEVLRLLPSASILHLACHGIQNASEPLKSGFIMHDKMMEVGDLMRLNLPKARLAFLSACETAQGDMGRPDEALHLAATMLYAGFKSVIGTMWSMGDVDGPIMAKTVYSELFAGDGEMLDFDVVPYALDAAVRELRAQGLEPSRWAPYIHIGM